MILEILRAIIGFSLAIFIPGFILTLIIFKDSNWLEKIAFSITFSIMITIVIGISLGYNESVKNFTGGITATNVWFWELIVTVSLIAIYLMRKKYL